MVCLGSFKLQTMIAFNKKLLQGVQGGGFLEKSPPGRRRHGFLLRRPGEKGAGFLDIIPVLRFGLR
jgi:hypothetical protein